MLKIGLSPHGSSMPNPVREHSIQASLYLTAEMRWDLL